MAIYRGSGGAGDATNDITINRVTELTQEAEASATAAASSASSAATSASQASTYVATVQASADSAASSASDASDSATTASTAATAAETAQTAAETAQTAAETAETNAETAETNAASSATSAASSATAAATSATNAATSETNATTSETNASNSASAASTSATNAANSASAASTSATNASNAQSAAESARDATLAAYDQFDDRYLGAKASDPTVDNDGNALVAGSLYFDTTNQVMKLYTGSAWAIAYADFSNADTDDLSEGSTNLYYTDARVGSYLTTNSYATQSYVTTALGSYATTTALTNAVANSSNWDTAYSWGDHAGLYDAAGTAVALSIALG
jgi:hypothetical protein